jgi:hypothetical protein
MKTVEACSLYICRCRSYWSCEARGSRGRGRGGGGIPLCACPGIRQTYMLGHVQTLGSISVAHVTVDVWYLNYSVNNADLMFCLVTDSLSSRLKINNITDVMYVCLFSNLSARKQTVYFNFKLPWTCRPDSGNIREEDGLKGEVFGGKEMKSGSMY